MCGLTALVDAELPIEERKMRTHVALEKMASRGPDSQDVWSDETATLGHVRLSIIDSAGSHQPMISPDGRYVIVFNGEIYNYKELLDGLVPKWNFVTAGDTEVLLAGLVIYGIDFVSRLEGMWAFFLWDSLDKKALMSRDRSGKKPLFYKMEKESIMCSSILPSLRELSVRKWSNDFNSVADYFRYGFSLPGRTFYEEVFEVLPAQVVEWHAGKITKEYTYWKPLIKKYDGSYRDAKERLRFLLINSVKKRLVSDVEVGCFLSGGMDSSIIAAIAAKEIGVEDLKTFTIGFEEKSYDESPFARSVSKHLNVEGLVKTIGSWDSSISSDLMQNHFAQPFSDPSIIPTTELSRFSSEYVRVALSGDGSDELFCGYERYKARAIVSHFLKIPKSFRALIVKSVAQMPEVYGHHSRSLLKKLKLLLESSQRWETSPKYIAPTFFSCDMYAQCFPDLVHQGYGESIQKPSDLSDVQAMMQMDFHVYLPQDIHAKVDRASMRHSLEVRAPFMDSELIEFAMSLPEDWCFSYFQNKKILAETFSDLLPNNIFKRRKQGFSVPIAFWMQGVLGDAIEEKLEGLSCDVVNEEAVKKMLSDHRRKVVDHSFRLWTIYQYLDWQSSRGNLAQRNL